MTAEQKPIWQAGDPQEDYSVDVDRDGGTSACAVIDECGCIVGFAITDVWELVEATETAQLFAAAPETAAERDRLAQEVERYAELKTAAGYVAEILEEMRMPDHNGIGNPFYAPTPKQGIVLNECLLRLSAALAALAKEQS